MTTIQAGPPTSCSRCWATMDRAERFCGHCGSPRPAAVAGHPPAAVPPPVSRPRHAAPDVEVAVDDAVTAPIAIPGPRVRPDQPRPGVVGDTAVVAPPAWASWAAAAGIAIVGLVSLLSSFDLYFLRSGDSAASLPIALANAVIPIGVAVLAALGVRALLAGAADASALAGVVVGAATTSAVMSGSGQGLGVIAGLATLVAAVGVLVLVSTDGDRDPLTAARLVILVTGVGALAAAARSLLEVAAYSGSGVSVFGALLWLGVGSALLAARTVLWPQRIARLVVAAAFLADLVAVLCANDGEASGALLLGLHLAVVVLLFLPAPARARFGEAPLPGLVSARDSVRAMLARSLGSRAETGRAMSAARPGLAAALALLPAWAWVAIGFGAVIAITGASIYFSHSTAADACTIVSGKHLSLVRDTPACDAAFGGQSTGEMIMGVGVLVALAPIRLVSWWQEKSSSKS